ncbi:MAG: hypothetical protein WC675_02400 [Patescibacteria group bacterium]|jgi:hypothetical protein
MWWKLFIRSCIGSLILALVAGLIATRLGDSSRAGLIAKYVCWLGIGIPSAICIIVAVRQFMVSMITGIHRLIKGHSQFIGGLLVVFGFGIAAGLGGAETDYDSVLPNIIAGLVGLAMMFLGTKLLQNSKV